MQTLEQQSVAADGELLARYVRGGSAEAFGELVQRHGRTVYAAALRQLRRPDLAEDVTQAVFLVLSRKAGTLTTRPSIGGWLLTVTRYAAIDAMRKESTRGRHERSAASARPESTPGPDAPADDLAQQAALLDAALARLNSTDREAVVLRYFHDLSLSDVGQRLHITEEAARKRVARAVEKLREIASRSGVTVTSASLAAIAHDVAGAPPASLMTSLSGIPLPAGASVSTLAHAIAKGTIHIMAYAKAQLLVGSAAALLLTAGAGIEVVRTLRAEPAEVTTPAAAAATPAPAQATPAPAAAAPGDWATRLNVTWENATITLSRRNADGVAQPVSRDMQIQLQAKVTDPAGIYGLDTNNVIVTRMLDQDGKDITARVQPPDDSFRNYQRLSYQTTFDPKTGEQRDVLSPKPLWIRIQPGTPLPRISRIEGYVRCLTAEKVETVDVPYTPGGKGTTLLPGVSVRFARAEVNGNAYHYELELAGGSNRPGSPYRFTGSFRQEQGLPDRILLENYLVDPSGQPLARNRFGGVYPMVGGMAVGSGGFKPGQKIAALRYEIAVHPREQQLPFVVTGITTPDAP